MTEGNLFCPSSFCFGRFRKTKEFLEGVISWEQLNTRLIVKNPTSNPRSTAVSFSALKRDALRVYFLPSV